MRAALQNALDSGYVPKMEHLPLNVVTSAGKTRSFGETDASELSTIMTVTDNDFLYLCRSCDFNEPWFNYIHTSRPQRR
jgi:hypothetical protein